MFSKNDELFLKMEQFENNFYGNNNKNKNWLFKKNQKIECAQKMSEKFDLNEMIERTIYIIPNSNNIIFDYTMFKLYACPENYDTIINYVIKVYDLMLLKYENFEINVILETFTMSAAERYKEAIRSLCNKCMTSKTKYLDLITKMNVYYTPSMIEPISILFRPFIDINMGSKVVLYSKVESPQLLQKLLSTEK
jgi:hypothetical protein